MKMGRAMSFGVGVALLAAMVCLGVAINGLVWGVLLALINQLDLSYATWTGLGPGFVVAGGVLVAYSMILYRFRARLRIGWVLMGSFVVPALLAVGLIALFFALGGTTGPR